MGIRTLLNTFIAIFGVLSISLTAVAEPIAYNPKAYQEPKSSKNLSFESLFSLYQTKCIHAKNPPHPCFLTEKDVDTKRGRADHVLLFRGEPSLKPLPATSNFYRWALSTSAVCTDNCTSSAMMTYLFDVSRNLSPVADNEALFFRDRDKSWRDDSGDLVRGNLTRGDSGLEVLAKTHKIGAGLYFEDDKKKMFDPMVSFSLDPLVADLFARMKENNGGVLWIASVPRTAVQFMKGSECKKLIPEIGKVYDFNGCIDTALNELEIEVNAVMYLPSLYYYGRILNR